LKSFHFRFASDAKASKKTLFSHRSETNFASVLLQSENDGSFRFFFVLFALRFIKISMFPINAKQAKNIEAIKISLLFCFEVKMTAHHNDMERQTWRRRHET
jgi:hypothetical protein